MFNDFFSKFFNTKAKKASIYNNAYYYDSNGVIKTYENIIKLEKEKLQISEDTIKEFETIAKRYPKEDERFELIMHELLKTRHNTQESKVNISEDFIFIMKNMVALEKEVISLVSRISDNPKVREDGVLWREIKETHLPRLRSFGNIMEEYAKKRQKDLEETK